MSAHQVEALLENPQQAPIKAPLKAAFALAHAMTKTPQDGARIQASIHSLQDLGVAPAAIEDAIAIAHHFNYINRVADTLDFPLPQDNGKKLGRFLDLAKKVVSTKKPTPYHTLCPDTGLQLPSELMQTKAALLHSVAGLAPSLRRNIEGYCANLRGSTREHTQVPEPLQPLLNKIATDAYKVIDEDIQALKEQGYSENLIFELVICACFGAAMAPLETAYAALAGQRCEPSRPKLMQGARPQVADR